MTVIASGMDGAPVGRSVTFLRLPGASGERNFTPLFDIVKHTTTEGSSALFTVSGELKTSQEHGLPTMRTSFNKQ